MANKTAAKKYHCDCQAHCGGDLKEVSRGAFRWHEKGRVAQGSSVPASLRQCRLDAGINPRPHKRKKRNDRSQSAERGGPQSGQSSGRSSPDPGTGQGDHF
ncbi:hypothetical protein BS17DRAFT_113255 [Gyrodon lividus]|nr:hypothetical protein BS17DRAFT_113255 [Gyrodon lividus]